MSLHSLPSSINVTAFAAAAQTLKGTWPADATADQAQPFERLAAESCEPGVLVQVSWVLTGEMRQATGGMPQPWLHLEAEARLPLVCQRCLAPVLTTVSSQRSFRFVADEATAAAEDDASEEDVLVLSPRFDWLQLVEDELIMSLPLIPMHEQCPQPIAFVEDPSPGGDAPDRIRPFEGLLDKMKHSQD